MPDEPTIWDILGYEEDAQSGTWDEEGNPWIPSAAWGELPGSELPEGVTMGYSGGQEDMLAYLMNILTESEYYTGDPEQVSTQSGVDWNPYEQLSSVLTEQIREHGDDFLESFSNLTREEIFGTSGMFDDYRESGV